MKHLNKCQNCNGTGEVPHHKAIMSRVLTDKCKDCNGTGRVNMEVIHTQELRKEAMFDAHDLFKEL